MNTTTRIDSAREANMGEDYDAVRAANASTLENFDAGVWTTLRSLYIWFMGAIVTVTLGSIATPLALVRADRWIHKIAGLWGRTLLRLMNVRLHTHNGDRLYSGDSTLVLSNHQSISDIFVFYAILNKIQFRWMAKHTLFRLPIIGWAMSGAGYIPVDRSNKKKAQESMFRAADQIKDGKSVIVFPEGTTGHNDGRMIGFKKGGFLLAKKSKATIQPITQYGANEIVPEQAGRFMQRIYPGHIYVYVHEPIHYEDYKHMKIEELCEYVREIIEKPLENHL